MDQDIAVGRTVLSVSELTYAIKSALEERFPLVYVEGEISNVRPSSSGHLYFSLKDEGAILPVALFSRAAKEVKFKLEDGLKVICAGAVEVYPPHGRYQLIIQSIEPKGIGSLQLALEQLKKKLEKEGLFSQEHKRQIPHLPSRIGIVTSPHGAAIKDIFKVLERRFKDVHVIVCPAKVQGEGAKEEIAQAIVDCNAYNESVPASQRIEVLIVGRGGGSIEDLWAFNEEIVARAIYASKIPVISAVGHERDVTVADLVADLRAPTPSVAAEVVLPMKQELQEALETHTRDLHQALRELIAAAQESIVSGRHRLSVSIGHCLVINAGALAAATKKLGLLNPRAALERHQVRIADLAAQCAVRMGHFISLRAMAFAKAAEKLSNLSPLAILSRGYSITFRTQDDAVIRDAGVVAPGDMMRTKVYRGEILSQVKEVTSNGGN